MTALKERHSVEQTVNSRLTKIVATLGPASRHSEGIYSLISSGANVFRFNYSHAEYEELEKAYVNVRKISKELGKPVGILSDLQGPKFRVGFFDGCDGIPVKAGQSLRFAYSESNDGGNEGLVVCNVKPMFEAFEIGNTVLFDDGNIQMKVTSRVSSTEVIVEVLTDGTLKQRKGINVPEITIPVAALSDKDKTDCLFSLKQGTDFMALSFVQRPEDVIELRDFMLANGCIPSNIPKIIVKIEKPQAVERLDDILAEADGVMVARGDLGVELPAEQVPAAQKMMIRKCIEAGKPVITATQMLESMTSAPVPTRAEVSDIANAVYDGSDATMLSGESAYGDYPTEAVKVMAKVQAEARKHYGEFTSFDSLCYEEYPESVSPEIVARAAVDATWAGDIDAIVVMSYSGAMAQRVSKYRPEVPIIALTPNESVYYQLTLLYAVLPVQFKASETTDATLSSIRAWLLEKGLVSKGANIVVCAGTTELAGLSNSLLITRV